MGITRHSVARHLLAFAALIPAIAPGQTLLSTSEQTNPEHHVSKFAPGNPDPVQQPAKQLPPPAYRATANLADWDAWKMAHPAPPLGNPQPAPRGVPANDNCASAQVVGNGRTPYDAIGATTDGTMACGFNVGNDVWFRFTPTENGPVSVTTCDDSRSYDTVMTVYGGGCGSAALGCDDDGGACSNPPGGGAFSGSTVTFNGVAGASYTIQVGCYNSGAAGVSALSISSGACNLTPPGPGTPENEPCGADANGGCNSIPEIFGSISCGEVVSGTAWAFAGTRDTDWYELTLDGPTQVTVTGQGQFPLQLFIIGNVCPAGIIAAGSAPTCGIATVTATVGGSVRIFAGNTGFEGNPCGGGNDYWIQVTTCTPIEGVGNDFCADATDVGEGTFDYDLTTASNDWTGTCGATDMAPDVWFRYTPSFTGGAVVSTCGLTGGDSTITILAECGGPQILCLDDFCGLQTEVSFGVTQGEDYFIRMAGFAGEVHAGQFNISRLPPCVLTPPGPTTPEGEPCGSELNGGCNSQPPVFGTIHCDQIILGSARASDGTRDADWYDLPLDGPHSVTISAQAQFPIQLFILNNECPVSIIGAASAPRCGIATLTTQVGGSCRIFAGNVGVDGNPCGSDNMYWLSVDSCVPIKGPTNDDCADAIGITGPGPHAFDNAIATTDGAADPLCDAFGADQITKDLWWTWTSDCPAGQQVAVSTCGQSGVDTRIAVYDGASCIGDVLACNDDASDCGLQSRATWIAGAPGSVYKIRVGAFPGAPGGPGSFTIECFKPCLGIDPDPNGVDEEEPCGEDTNGGCNSVPNQWFDVTCNSVVNATAWAGGGTRDTDWYRMIVPDSGRVSVEVTTEIPIAVFILSISGVDPCGAITFNAIGGAAECDTAAISASGLVPGDAAYVFIGAGGSTFDPSFPCGGVRGNDYIARFDVGVPCPPRCRCDFNDDGRLNSQDFFDYLTCFFGGGCPQGRGADYNQDHIVNTQDFFDFLSCFLAAPAPCF